MPVFDRNWIIGLLASLQGDRLHFSESGFSSRRLLWSPPHTMGLDALWICIPNSLTRYFLTLAWTMDGWWECVLESAAYICPNIWVCSVLPTYGCPMKLNKTTVRNFIIQEKKLAESNIVQKFEDMTIDNNHSLRKFAASKRINPSSIYSWFISHILEHEFFCLGRLGYTRANFFYKSDYATF